MTNTTTKPVLVDYVFGHANTYPDGTEHVTLDADAAKLPESFQSLLREVLTHPESMVCVCCEDLIGLYLEGEMDERIALAPFVMQHGAGQDEDVMMCQDCADSSDMSYVTLGD